MMFYILYFIAILHGFLNSYQAHEYPDNQIGINDYPGETSSSSTLGIQSYSYPWSGEYGLGKRVKNGRPRKLRSGSGQDRSRYRGPMKWKKYPETPMKAGDIARLLMEIAERRGVTYNNKAIRYGLS